jgi:shikimate kinase
MRIFFVGFMGSGKTTHGRLLAEKLNYDFLDLDDYIEEKHKHSISSIIALVGEDGFRKVEKACLHEVLTRNNIIISTGGGTPCFFDNMEIINNHGLSIFLKADTDILCKRLINCKTEYRPLIKGKSPEELKDYITKTLENRESFYSQAHYILDAENITTDQIAEIVRKVVVLEESIN